MAAYGAELKQGKSPAQAQAYLSQLLHHAVAQPSSASAALQTFLSGQGDVLLDYEDDALYAKKQGEAVQVVTPPQTILIQNPIAVTKTASPAAKAFLSYLLSPAGQTVWGQQGYRPVLPSVAAKFHFPKPKTLFTIDSLGGWTVGEHEVLRPRDGHRGQGRAVARRVHRQQLTASRPQGRRSGRGHIGRRPGSPGRSAGRPRTRRPQAGAQSVASSSPHGATCRPGRGRPRGPARRRPGARRHLPVAARPPPGRGAPHQRVQRRVERLLGGHHPTRGGGRARADAGVVGHRGRRQLRRRPRHRLRARARRLPRQGAAERGDRPALRAADDRGRPHAARALRRRQPLPRQPGRHPARHRRRAALRDAALLRPQRPTRAGRARCGDRRGRVLPRRHARARCSAASSSRASCRRSSPAPASPSPAPWASSARSCSSRATCPFKTEVASSFIYSLSQSGDLPAASAVSVLLVVIALIVLLRHRLGCAGASTSRSPV